MATPLKIILQLICYCVYPFSFLFPRSKKKWTLGSFRGAFNDNAKYLFIHLQQTHPDIQSAWLSTNRDTVRRVRDCQLSAYYLFSPRGLWHALTSKYWLYNAYTSDIMFCLSGTAVTVNLWHGIPIKSIEFDITSGPLVDVYVKKTLRSRFFYPQVYKRPDYMLAPSEFYQNYFSRAFRIAKEQCILFSCPRNTILVCDEQQRADFIARYEPNLMDLIGEIRKHAKTFIYMPTWRDSQKDIFSSHLNLATIEQIMAAIDGLFLLKPHANTIVNEAEVQGYPHIRLIDRKADVYPLLPYTDVLVTDYSSIMYDYMLMEGKSIVLYLYDFADYTERTFIFPFDDNVIGQKVYTFDDLCALLGEPIAMDEERRTRLIGQFWSGNACANSSEGLIAYLQERK